MSSEHNPTNGNEDTKRKRKRRWGDATPAGATEATSTSAAPATATTTGPIDSKAKAMALKASIAAKLAALKAKTGGGKTAAMPAAGVKRPASTAISSTAMTAAASGSGTSSNKRAKHYDLDLSVTGPTFNKEAAPPKPKVNPYLAHRQIETETKSSTDEKEDDGKEKTAEQQPETAPEDEMEDDRLQAAKIRPRHRALRFVEPGTFVEIAERKRQKAANAEQSGFSSGRKAGTYYTSQTMANIYGSTDVMDDDDNNGLLAVRPEANPKTDMPHVVEWWDLELLPSQRKKQVAAYEGKALQKETQAQMQQTLESTKAKQHLAALEDQEAQDLQTDCLQVAGLSYSKTAALIQHIVPIKPPNAQDGPPVEPTLYLTKKEMKRQRKLRRQEKQRELQDLQAAGLIKAPEPRLTLQNFIKVLGDQAYLDPSQMEQTVREKMEARQRAHLEHNAKNRLTKEQRAAKLAAKLQEDTQKEGVHVAIFYVKDMSHPYHRTKVDLNAQQYNITGGVVECEVPKLACVICEGGPKAIRKYIRLMTVRMKWKGPDDYLEDDDEDEGAEDDEAVPKAKFNPDNLCELVWTGMATKRFFKGFIFQACESSHEAAKILRAKGVGHFWDQLLAHASGKGEKFALKLTTTTEKDDQAVPPQDSEEAVAMEE